MQSLVVAKRNRQTKSKLAQRRSSPDFSLPPRKATNLDRFIPNRALQNNALANYMLTTNEPGQADLQNSEAYSTELLRAIFDTNYSAADIKTSSSITERASSARILPLFAQASRETLASPSRSPSSPFEIPNTPYCSKDLPGFIGDANVSTLDWSSDNQTLCCSFNEDVYALKGSDYEPIEVRLSPSALPPSPFFACSYRLASQKVARITEGDAIGVAWIDSNRIACGTTAHRVEIHDCSEARSLFHYRSADQSYILGLAWNKRTSILASSSTEGIVNMCDLRANTRTVGSLDASLAATPALAWSPNCSTLATGDSNGLVKTWDTRRLDKPLNVIEAHSGMHKALAWCPWDSSLLVTGGDCTDPSIRVWDTATAHLRASYDNVSSVSSLCWSTERRELVSTHCGAPFVAFWTLSPTSSKLRPVQQLNWYGYSEVFTGVVSPDGTAFAAASDGGPDRELLCFWEIAQAPRPSKSALPSPPNPYSPRAQNEIR